MTFDAILGQLKGSYFSSDLNDRRSECTKHNSRFDKLYDHLSFNHSLFSHHLKGYIITDYRNFQASSQILSLNNSGVTRNLYYNLFFYCNFNLLFINSYHLITISYLTTLKILSFYQLFYNFKFQSSYSKTFEILIQKLFQKNKR